ncbi:MAG: hypothetical protein M3O70_28835 [Actinomycetota bacterium]|nr:hypothetical protein [Actinomycetota bacterium]
MSDAPETHDGEHRSQEGSWLDAEVDGRSVRFWITVGSLIALVTLGFGAFWTYGLGRGPQMAGGGMGQAGQGGQMGGGQMTAEVPRVPPVFAYYDDREVFFIHTEASDPSVAQMLQQMMGSPVPVVASLAQVPQRALGNVYVFTNGFSPQGTPAGPFGFQPDVFDSAPGDPDYTPLRRVVKVTWNDPGRARLLTSVTDVTDAQDKGEITLQATPAVINAPLLTWPGGHR